MAGQMRASLKTFNTPRYSSLLEAKEKYFLGYWTLELSGRSFDPPPDLAAAENWLASAFREWKETEQDEAKPSLQAHDTRLICCGSSCQGERQCCDG